MAWEKELDVCREAARRAGEIALRYADRGVSVETKPDRSPVTAADRECEQVIVAALQDVFPRDGILGEEGARAEAASGRRWIAFPPWWRSCAPSSTDAGRDAEAHPRRDTPGAAARGPAHRGERRASGGRATSGR